MKRFIGGLLRNGRRALSGTTILHHHHHHQHNEFCAASAFAQVTPISEHTHDYSHAHRPWTRSEQAAGRVSHQHHPHQHPMASAIGPILHRFPRAGYGNISAFTSSTPLDLPVVTLATPPAMDAHTLASSAFKGPVQQATSCNAEAAEDLTYDDATPSPRDLSTCKLRRPIEIEDFLKTLRNSGRRSMSMEEVLEVCKQTGTATSDAEAEEVVKVLDEAGSILIFRQKVFLEPEKVAEVLSRAMPLPLAVEDDPRNREYARLQKEKEEIDSIAHRQVRTMLWAALGVLSAQSALFFRLTFWDLSWDVMEPVTFFVTSSGLLAGFFFFVITKRDPSYHDCMDALFASKQRKLMKKRNFDVQRFKELEVLCCFPSGRSSSSMQRQLRRAC